MSLDYVFALTGFAFVMSVSPGPANFVLMAAGANFGFARTLPLILGVSFGFLSMVLVIGLGLGPVIRANPVMFPGLRIACGLYVFWLAWKIATARPQGSTGPEPGALQKPLSFGHMALMQLLNPKAWTVALVLAASYLDPAGGIAALLAMIGIFALVNLPAISVWVISGAGLARYLQNPARARGFNIVMAVLLVASIVPALLR